MSKRNDNKADTVPPHAQLIEMARTLKAHIVYTAAKLDLADHLAQGPKSADELAGPTGTHAPSLYRFMRALATLGILTESDTRRFALTSLGEALKTGAPGSARATVLTLESDWWMNGQRGLLYALQTGKCGFEKSLGMPVFDWLAEHPEDASLFSQTMIGLHEGQPEAVAASYDFSAFQTIVDVGGASGQLLTTILGSCRGPRGILFDLAPVVRDAPTLIRARGLMDRVTIQAGSFFEGVPNGADAYLLSHIIHDWSEKQCLTILAQCRRAMHPTSCLLLIEIVLPPAGTPHQGSLLDVGMLLYTGGQERTEEEYAALLGKADLRLTRIVPTSSPVSIVEATIN